MKCSLLSLVGFLVKNPIPWTMKTVVKKTNFTQRNENTHKLR